MHGMTTITNALIDRMLVYVRCSGAVCSNVDECARLLLDGCLIVAEIEWHVLKPVQCCLVVIEFA
eukprot:15843093-Heterocapsa_arctica.AAC.1